MNNVIITTKKTNLVFLITSLAGALLTVVIGFQFVELAEEATSRWMFSTADKFENLAVLLFVLAGVEVGFALLESTTFADVYSDRIVGKGMHWLKVMEFDLTYDQITNISCRGMYLYINVSGERYRITTSVNRAKEIFDYYRSLKK